MGPSSPSMTIPPGEAAGLKGPETPMPSSPGDRVNRLSVRAGATLWVLGVAGFLFGMGVTQLGWDLLRSGPTPVYSLLHNYISDLGAVSCGPLPGRYVCSPWHEVFDLSAVALGLFGLKAYGPLYVGGMERLVVAPVLLWAILVGVAVLVGRRGLFAGGLALKDQPSP